MARPAKTYDEKIKEANRLRDIIRKRVNRLHDYEKETGAESEALNAIEENRRKYDLFSPETHRVKDPARKGMSEEDLDKMIKQEQQWLKNKSATVRGARAGNVARDKATEEMLKRLSGEEDVEIGKEVTDSFWDAIKEIRRGIQKKDEKDRTDAEKQILSDLRNDIKYKEVFENVMQGIDKGWDTKKIAKQLKSSLTRQINKEKAKRAAEQEELKKATGAGLPSDIKSAREAAQRRQEQGRLQGNKDRTKKPKQNKKR